MQWLDNHIPGNCITTDADENLLAVDNGIKIFPNPFSVSATVQIEKNIPARNGMIVLFDLTGRELRRIAITGNRIILYRNNISSGTYLLKIESEEIQKTFRIVIQ